MTGEDFDADDDAATQKSSSTRGNGVNVAKPMNAQQRKKMVKQQGMRTLRNEVLSKARAFAQKSQLFENGAPEDATGDAGFVLRVNALLAGSRLKTTRTQPDLAAAISGKGRLKPDAELIVFGNWLFFDGMPGFDNRGGKQPDKRVLLRTLATGMAELRRRKSIAKAAGPGAGMAKNALTATDLALRWAMLFKEPVKATDFYARVVTLERVLPAFLDHLGAGAMQHAGKTILSAPGIKAVYRAISTPARKGARHQPAAGSTTPSARKATRPPIVTLAQPSVPAKLAPFKVELRYSAPAREEECRNRPSGSLPPAILTYNSEPAVASSTGRTIRKDRQGMIELVPQFSIRPNFRVRALFDRIAVLVSISTRTSGPALKTLLKTETNVSSFAQDLTTVPPKIRDWRMSLPELDLTKHTGFHFAIMFQDPVPGTLEKALKIIDDRFGIEGPVELFLVELSVDFFPKAHRSPDEQILLREEMVGLLQRHHSASIDLLQGSQPQRPRDADARQVYEIESGERDQATRYLLRDRSSPKYADIDIHQPEVVARILRATQGDGPYLDATVLKGCDETGRKISIQHKVADQRNPARDMKRVLPDEERRARIELTLMGTGTLQEHGLTTVEKLGALPFRTLRKKLLHFRLPLVEPDQARLDEAIARMRSSGIYGIELAARVRALKDRQAIRAAGRPSPRRKSGAEAAMRDWVEVNTVVGEALDQLERRWRGFGWR